MTAEREGAGEVSKPEWVNIPHEHNWLCQDLRGDWWSFQKKPKPNMHYSWWGRGGNSTFHGFGKRNEQWYESLEKRP